MANRERIDEEELKKEELLFILLYSKAQKKILDIVSSRKFKGSNIQYQKKINSEVKKVLTDLTKETKEWVESNVPKNYKKAVYRSIDDSKSVGIELKEYEKFSSLHDQQIKILEQRVIDNLSNSTNYLNSTIKKTVKEIIDESVLEAKKENKSIKATRDILIRKFAENDVTVITTKNNRKISLDSYSKMVARTSTAEANNLGMVNHVKANGEDLVIMSSHGSTCKLCAPLEGRIYSVSGTSTKYPPLSKAYVGNYGVIHPNCLHFLRPYNPDADEKAEENEIFSNRPFDVDPRTQEQKDRYDKTQSENVKRNTEKRQWERYRIVVPDSTPNTLAGFRRMKQSGSQTWSKLQSTYRKANKN